MMRRLQDRIRQLCNEAIDVEDIEALKPVIEELNEALREHIWRTRFMAKQRLTVGLPLVERRVNAEW